MEQTANMDGSMQVLDSDSIQEASMAPGRDDAYDKSIRDILFSGY